MFLNVSILGRENVQLLSQFSILLAHSESGWVNGIADSARDSSVQEKLWKLDPASEPRLYAYRSHWI